MRSSLRALLPLLTCRWGDAGLFFLHAEISRRDIADFTERSVTLTKEILDHLGVKPGDELELELLPDRKAVVRACNRQVSVEIS
ncbi:hypothetical protein CWR43_23590 [Rhizobium sullae]|uniref:AbrB/MazE/SpoVT family DNA-binding domain-containing protein n=1 Tax=Rhizobium sullae TaxID=50338 RepID=A0A2N0D535_RHISU|nr:hypothetical protein CWR43_23590 [Rhizobium sullae]